MTCIFFGHGNAFLYSLKAKRKGKIVINLCEFNIE